MNNLSLSLSSGPLWPGVMVPDRVPSMGQIEQTVCKQMTDVKLWQLYSNTWKNPDSFKNAINKMCLQIIHIFDTYVRKGFDIEWSTMVDML